MGNAELGRVMLEAAAIIDRAAGIDPGSTREATGFPPEEMRAAASAIAYCAALVKGDVPRSRDPARVATDATVFMRLAREIDSWEGI